MIEILNIRNKNLCKFLFIIILIIFYYCIFQNIISIIFKRKNLIKENDNSKIINKTSYNKTNIINLNNFKNNRDNSSSNLNTSFNIKECIKYVNNAREGKILYENNLKYSEKPKISVVISIYNGDRFINSTIKSIQNQKMKEIEIIIVDDCSTDNSVKYIKEAQKKDPRIILVQNEKNYATLYSKSKGMLKAKGKYIFTLDSDDIVITDDLFDVIYNEAEKGNYDILEYKWIMTFGYELRENYYKINSYCCHKDNEEIFQPKLRQRFCRNEKGKLKLQDKLLWGRLIKTSVMIKVLNIIGENDLKRRMVMHDDSIIIFILFQISNSFKKIDKIGMCHFLHDNSNTSQKKRFQKEKINATCLSYLNYVDLLYKHSENNTEAREEAYYAYKIWYLSSKCKYYEGTLLLAYNLTVKYLNDPLIKEENKNIIKKKFYDNRMSNLLKKIGINF